MSTCAERTDARTASTGDPTAYINAGLARIGTRRGLRRTRQAVAATRAARRGTMRAAIVMMVRSLARVVTVLVYWLTCSAARADDGDDYVHRARVRVGESFGFVEAPRSSLVTDPLLAGVAIPRDRLVGGHQRNSRHELEHRWLASIGVQRAHFAWSSRKA